MTLGSLFDGLGGWQLAATRAGIKPVWSSEIDKFCLTVTARHFPGTIQLGDINTISDAPHVDIITAGSPCFPAGTLILTTKGYCPIESIVVGDRVLTHTGKWQRVLNIGSRFCETVVMKGFGHPCLETTANHPFYSAEKKIRWNNIRRSYDRFIETPSWTEAQNMRGLFWATPITCDPLEIPPIKTIDIRENAPPTMDNNFWWVIGRWLGDGWLRNGQRTGRKQGQTWGQVVICCSHKEKKTLAQRLENTSLKWTAVNEKTVCKFRTSHMALTRWLIANFGEKANGKKIPMWALSLDREHRKNLLDGYFSADGWQRDDGVYSATTISKSLALGIRLIAESLGYSAPVYFAKVAPTKIIEGRTVNQHNFYIVRYYPPKPSSSRTVAFGLSWGLVRSITPTGTTKQVFNLEVENDNSYCAENIIVHNCQNLSVAGNRSGLNGKQSSLFFKAIKLVRRIHPQFFVWENVPGAFSSNGGNDFRTVLEEIVEEPIPLPKHHWSNAGMVDGRHVQVCWRILDAQYWRVPQRRRRIFLVADFAGRRAAEILFERQSMRGHFASGTGEERQTADRTGSRADSSSYFIAGNIINREEQNGGHQMGINKGVSYTLNTIDRHAVYDMTHADEVLRPVTGDKSNCLNSRMGTGGNQVPLVGNHILRRLTPLECERLQGLPDNWTDGGSDAARYRAIGNGMAQPCADWIMRQIKRHADC